MTEAESRLPFIDRVPSLDDEMLHTALIDRDGLLEQYGVDTAIPLLVDHIHEIHQEQMPGKIRPIKGTELVAAIDHFQPSLRRTIPDTTFPGFLDLAEETAAVISELRMRRVTSDSPKYNFPQELYRKPKHFGQ